MQVKFKGFPVGGEDGIFSVERSQNVKSEDCIPGNIPYITRTALNNGMAGLCGNKTMSVLTGGGDRYE